MCAGKSIAPPGPAEQRREAPRGLGQNTPSTGVARPHDPSPTRVDEGKSKRMENFLRCMQRQHAKNDKGGGASHAIQNMATIGRADAMELRSTSSVSAVVTMGRTGGGGSKRNSRGSLNSVPELTKLVVDAPSHQNREWTLTRNRHAAVPTNAAFADTAGRSPQSRPQDVMWRKLRALEDGAGGEGAPPLPAAAAPPAGDMLKELIALKLQVAHQKSIIDALGPSSRRRSSPQRPELPNPRPAGPPEHGDGPERRDEDRDAPGREREGEFPDDENRALRREIRELKEERRRERDARAREAAEARARIAELTCDCTALEEECTALEEANDDLLRRHVADDIRALRREICDLKEERRRERDARGREAAKAGATVVALTRENEALEEENDDLVTEAGATIAELEEENDGLRRKLRQRTEWRPRAAVDRGAGSPRGPDAAPREEEAAELKTLAQNLTREIGRLQDANRGLQAENLRCRRELELRENVAARGARTGGIERASSVSSILAGRRLKSRSNLGSGINCQSTVLLTRRNEEFELGPPPPLTKPIPRTSSFGWY